VVKSSLTQTSMNSALPAANSRRCMWPEWNLSNVPPTRQRENLLSIDNLGPLGANRTLDARGALSNCKKGGDGERCAPACNSPPHRCLRGMTLTPGRLSDQGVVSPSSSRPARTHTRSVSPLVCSEAHILRSPRSSQAADRTHWYQLSLCQPGEGRLSSRCCWCGSLS